MADTAAAAPAVTKSPKKKASKPKKPAAHPKYSEMIHQAIAGLKERGGSSRQAILKYIVKNFNVGKDEKTVNSHLKMSLKAAAKNGSLKQHKGTGATGRFSLGTKKAEKAKKPKKVKKPKAAKPKKVKKPKAAKAKKAAKKPAAAKKPKAAKPKKAKAAKPKKASAKKAAAPAAE